VSVIHLANGHNAIQRTGNNYEELCENDPNHCSDCSRHRPRGRHEWRVRQDIRHDGNVVKPTVHDRDGKQVNRLPGRSSGAAPKKVKCGINGRSNYCAVVQ
jgi:hypothetical protein